MIVGEEVKTDDQGEVIGLFIKEKIPRGVTLQETIAEIKRQGGAGLRARTRSTACTPSPTTSTCSKVVEDIDVIEVFNPRVAFSAFNEEAARFARQVPDRRRRGLRLATSPRASAACGSRCATSTARRSSSSRCAMPTSSARSSRLLYVQALKFLQTKAPRPARTASGE